MKIRLIALLAVVALSVMAVPASADPGVGVLNGNAAISTGLGIPGVHNGASGTWHLTGTVIGSASGSVDIIGTLGANAAGIGAGCGMSSGANGAGTAVGHNVSNVGWVSSAGGTIPATGDYSGHGSGTVLALVQAQGGAANCANGAANNFTVIGAVALV